MPTSPAKTEPERYGRGWEGGSMAHWPRTRTDTARTTPRPTRGKTKSLGVGCPTLGIWPEGSSHPHSGITNRSPVAFPATPRCDPRASPGPTPPECEAFVPSGLLDVLEDGCHGTEIAMGSDRPDRSCARTHSGTIHPSIRAKEE